MAGEFLPRLRQGVPVGVGPKGERIEPSPNLILTWQQLVTQLELIPGLEAAIAAADAAAANAQAAADNANAAAEATTSEQSIVNSYPANPTVPPLISADSAGDVTISDHDRIYGDPTLNPTVSVDGGVVASGGTSGDVIRVYYNDPTRAGGAVTYLFTTNTTDTPVQGGDTHVVGAVTVPAAGSQSGNGVRPPGYVEP